jgi:outer membrane scaffolding protein for murein synthesis (MipA/OmpV family)
MRILLALLLALPALALAKDDDFTLVGAAVRTRPEFDGSSDRTLDVHPVLRYYGDRWFARTTQGLLEGGARWNVRRLFDVGAQVNYEQGPRDGSPDASLGLHAEIDRMMGRVPLNGLVRVRQHLDSDRGAALDLRGNVGVFGRYGILAAVFAQATFANEKNFQSYYGVNESGYLMRIVGIQGAYDLTPRWSLTSNLEHHHLSDAAAKSPFITQRGGVYFSAGLSYRF